jgi:hypothetical protein
MYQGNNYWCTMKNLYKFFLALGVCSTIFSQIPEIKRLPVQDNLQSIQESTPIWISENEIIIFYINETRDTIFSTRSTNGGRNWIQSKVVAAVIIPTSQESTYLTGLKMTSGRLLLAWSIVGESMKLIYSDDQGDNWSSEISILGAGSPDVFKKSSYNLNLSEWLNGEVCLSFYSNSASQSFYKLSADKGVSWNSDPFEFPKTTAYKLKELTILSTNQNSLLALYEKSTTLYSGIYSRISNDNGLSWSEPSTVIDGIALESRPRVAQLENKNILIAYESDNTNADATLSQHDIYYQLSYDNGSTWSDEKRFTRYVGEDILLNISGFREKVFISFATERYSTSYPNLSTFQISYGILKESADKFTPPKVFNSSVPQDLINFESKQYVFQAKVLDDEVIRSVKVFLDDSSFTREIFDDGMHNDKMANDSIFGNIFPLATSGYSNDYILNVNQIELPLDNKGVLADVNVTHDHKAEVIASDYSNNKSTYKSDFFLGGNGSGGKYEGGGFLFSAGFFISGYAGGNLFANGVASSSIWEDYQPGKVYSSPDDPLNGIYVVNKSDPPFGFSWRKWKDAVSLGADFYDGNGDGIYNPVDKNLNQTWDLNEDMPLLIGDETVWCVYNDGVVRSNYFYSMGIEVKQTLFASSNPDLENVIFIKYELTNTGKITNVLDSVFFSPWDDTDIGDATDDLGGCDTLLQSLFTYNAFDDMVYGSNPPAYFTSLLQGPVIQSFESSDTAYIRNGIHLGEQALPGYKNLNLYSFTGYTKGAPSQADPQNVNHVWNYVHARDREGNPINPCDTLWGKVYGNINCSQVNPMFWFSGDPVTQIGWLDKQVRDDRKFSSIGPLTLEKNKSVEIILALVVGRGTDYLNSITVARENVQRAIEEYESNFASMTYTAPPPVPVNDYILYQNYPNPFNPTTTIRYELPQAGQVTIEVFDILGQKVKTILNEFKNAGRYETVFSSAGLASGVYIYQLRVNNFITSKKMLLVK